MSLYNYVAYGLNVASDLECPEFCPSFAPIPDVTVHFGSVSDSIDNPTGCGILYQTNTDTFLLKLDLVARYLVSNGTEIIIDVVPDADMDAVRLFLFGSCFGALLFQRGLLPLHGSAILTPKGVVVFAGASGHGKSTLAAAFHRMGYQVISDDVTAITIKDKVPLVLPSFPRLMLWEDAIEHLDLNKDYLRPARAQLEKYHYRIEQPILAGEYPLHAVYLLELSKASQFFIKHLSGIDKIQDLINNTYRKQFILGMNLASQHFKQVTKVAERTRISIVTRPDNTYQLDELADLIQQDFMT